MKIIITEEQYSDLWLKRRLAHHIHKLDKEILKTLKLQSLINSGTSLEHYVSKIISIASNNFIYSDLDFPIENDYVFDKTMDFLHNYILENYLDVIRLRYSKWRKEI